MADKRGALNENVNMLASDLKALGETLLRDPKQQAKKERRWRALYTITGVVFTIAARRLAIRAWSILTGEQPPTRRPPTKAEPEKRPEAAPTDAGQETVSAT